MEIKKKYNFRIEFIHEINESTNTLIDSHIYLDDGRIFYGSFYTCDYVQAFLNMHPDCDSVCENGYFWSVDSIIVKKINKDIIEKVIAEMLEKEYFFLAFSDITQGVIESNEIYAEFITNLNDKNE